MERTLAHFAMAAASRQSSDFNFADFESVFQAGRGTIDAELSTRSATKCCELFGMPVPVPTSWVF